MNERSFKRHNIVTMASPRQRIYERLTNEITAFRDIHGRSGVFRQLKSATELTAYEYGNRFLVELIQNAHDALDKDGSDGRIAVVLDLAEGTFGCLYVANTGTPFTDERFAAICEFAQSSKRPGESIGNKGIGFRSVLQVTSWPEVYSRSPASGRESGRFDGYCFRFAHPEDIALAAGDQELASLIEASVSPYSLPVPVDGEPETVRRFAFEGFATVIRLPLRDAQATVDAARALNDCMAGDVPLPVFLSRVDELSLEKLGEETARAVRITRCEESLELDCDDISATRVRLSRIGGGGTTDSVFLVGAAVIPEAAMHTVITASIAQGQIPDAWQEWTGEGRVSVAVSTSGAPISRLYNYLPMGSDTESPFLGLLDAPFFSRISRTSLDPSIALNKFLLDKSAEVCLTFAEGLARTGVPEFAGIVARLLAWNDTNRPRLIAAASGAGTPLGRRALIPVQSNSSERQKFAPLDETFVWEPPAERAVLSVRRLVAMLGVPFLLPSIREEVRKRLTLLRRAVSGADFTPSARQLADWAERLAAALHTEGVETQLWDGFYADLPAVFASMPSALQGRRLLLDEDGQLQYTRAGSGPSITPPPGPAIFLPPVRERVEDEEEVAETADVEIPFALRVFLRYTHPALGWKNANDVSVRQFFVVNRLIRRFGKRELREFIRQLLSSERDAQVYTAALEFVHRLTLSGPSDQAAPGPAELHLRVPVRSGQWIEAGDAVFSQTWGHPAAAKLEELLRLVGDDSPELMEYADDLLVAPEEWPFAVERSGFASFLERIGVKDGLWPWIRRVSTVKRAGWQWRSTPAVTAKETSLSSTLTDAWSQEIAQRQPSLRYPNHDYELDDDGIWTVAGQDTYDHWPSAAREIFAELLARGLTGWADDVLWCPLSKVGGLADHCRLPSPVLALIHRLEWIPTSSNIASGALEFRRPSETWFEFDEHRAPAFVPAARPTVRRAVTQSSLAVKRLRELAGARFWSNHEDAPAAVVTLANIFVAGAVPEDAANLFSAVYADRWYEVLRSASPLAVNQVVNAAPLVVRRSGRLEVWSASSGHAPLVIVDQDDPIRVELVEEARAAIFSINAGGGQVHDGLARLKQYLGDRARLLSELSLSLTVDGRPFSATLERPLLTETALARAGELAALLFVTRGDLPSQSSREMAIQRLRSTRLAPARTISVAVEGIESVATVTPSVLGVVDAVCPTLLVSAELLGRAPLSHEYAPALCEIVSLPQLSGKLELALRRAAEWSEESTSYDPSSAVDRELGCYALQISADRLREARSLIDGSLATCRYLLLPVLCYTLGDDWTEAWRDTLSTCADTTELTSALSSIRHLLPVPPEVLVSHCCSEASLENIRDALDLDFGRFNRALRTLGGGYSPLVDREGHLAAFKAYLSREHVWIDCELRQAFWETFEDHQPLAVYVSARSRDNLEPDPEWLETYRLPPEDMMKLRVEDWLRAFPVGERRSRPLLPLDAVRSTNRDLLDDFQASASDVIAAWSAKHQAVVPSVWNNSDANGLRLAQLAFDEGWSDFGILDQPFVAAQLARSGLWPSGMPFTTAANELELSDRDLERPRRERENARRERSDARRSITVAGSRVIVDELTYKSLAEALQGTLTSTSLTVSDRLSTLAAAERADAARKASGPRTAAFSLAGLTDVQRAGIGFAGEWFVREWLKRRFPTVDVDECWKSGYKNAFLGRTDGDDTLGYDFEVITKSRRYLYEVKASSGEDTVFALGESEVREAQSAFADRTTRYRILFVMNALNDSRNLIVLPNPFSKRGTGTLRVVGQGMRFRFELDRTPE